MPNPRPTSAPNRAQPRSPGLIFGASESARQAESFCDGLEVLDGNFGNICFWHAPTRTAATMKWARNDTRRRDDEIDTHRRAVRAGTNRRVTTRSAVRVKETRLGRTPPTRSATSLIDACRRDGQCESCKNHIKITNRKHREVRTDHKKKTLKHHSQITQKSLNNHSTITRKSLRNHSEITQK